MRGSRGIVAVALLALVACGGDDPKPIPTTAPPTVSPTPSSESPSPVAEGPTRADVDDTLGSAMVAARKYHARAGVFPPDAGRLADFGFRPKPGVVVDITRSGRDSVCIRATGGGLTRYITSEGGYISDHNCPIVDRSLGTSG